MYQVKESETIYIVDDKVVGVVSYPSIEKNVVNVCHTYVDEEFRSNGIASELLQHAFNYFVRNNIKIICTCSYANKWLSTHPEYKKVLKD